MCTSNTRFLSYLVSVIFSYADMYKMLRMAFLLKFNLLSFTAFTLFADISSFSVVKRGRVLKNALSGFWNKRKSAEEEGAPNLGGVGALGRTVVL